MRRLGAFCLFLGLAAPALAADPPVAEEKSVPWYRWLFLGERSKSAPKPEAAAATNAQPPAARPTPMYSKETIAKMMAEEQRVYLERLKAISKIRSLANDNGDEELMKKADEMEAQAEEIFKQRSARLPVVTESRNDRAALERGRDERPATAQRPATRRPTRGGDR
jgi:hypothetical protein